MSRAQPTRFATGSKQSLSHVPSCNSYTLHTTETAAPIEQPSWCAEDGHGVLQSRHSCVSCSVQKQADLKSKVCSLLRKSCLAWITLQSMTCTYVTTGNPYLLRFWSCKQPQEQASCSMYIHSNTASTFARHPYQVRT